MYKNVNHVVSLCISPCASTSPVESSKNEEQQIKKVLFFHIVVLAQCLYSPLCCDLIQGCQYSQLFWLINFADNSRSQTYLLKYTINNVDCTQEALGLVLILTLNTVQAGRGRKDIWCFDVKKVDSFQPLGYLMFFSCNYCRKNIGSVCSNSFKYMYMYTWVSKYKTRAVLSGAWWKTQYFNFFNNHGLCL